MTNYFIYALFFIAGAVVIFIAGKVFLKKWGTRLKSILEEIHSGVNPAGPDTLPGELRPVVEKLKIIIQQKTEPEHKQKSVPEEKSEAEKLRKLNDNLYLVNELGQNVTSSLNLQQSFEHLYATINSMMDAAVLELSVYDEATKGFKIFSNEKRISGSGKSDYINNISAWSFKNNREVFLADAEMDYGRYVFQPLILPDGRMAKSVITFPILNNNVVSGTLCVISFQKKSFDEYHCEIIRLLLGYISVAIQNAITHEELNLTKIRAEQSEKFKEQFLANMSHEIRTPINAVTGMTRLLLEKEPRPEQLRYLESIRNASDSLLVIINDILDLSKIEAGKVELEQIDFSVLDVVQHVKDIMHFKAEEKGLRILNEVEGTIAPVLIGDPTRLTQILINLVGNAIKFTEKGSVKISVRATQSEANMNQAAKDGQTASFLAMTFRVEDTGIGMTPDQQQKLFQNYAQASSDTTRKYGGTGLGLSISKQLVELQGGKIQVASEQGKGSVFTFTITYPVSKNKRIARKEKSVSKEMLQQLKGIKILLADDNEYNRIVARETLELKIDDIIIEEANDGTVALQMVKNNSYDLVLMDLVMPLMDGLEATRRIREEIPAPKNQIKILALTASVVKSEIDKCMAVGMNGFVPKPFKAHELIAAIYNALHSETTATFDENIQTKETNLSSGNQVDLNYLLEFTEGDSVRMQRYIELFIAKIPSGISALQTSIAKKDFEKIRITAHSMKPQLRFTGVMQGLDLAEKIESCCIENSELDKLPDLINELSGICESAVTEVMAYLESKKDNL